LSQTSGSSDAAPRTIQIALGAYSVRATYNGADSIGEGSLSPDIPHLSPAPGNYKLPQLITISDATPDAMIYYAVNDGPPTKYTKPFPLRGSDTIHAVAIVEANGKYLESPVVIACYNAVVPPPAPPVLSPTGGSFRSPLAVTIRQTTAGVTVYYSVNGGLAQRYTGPITVVANATIEAVAIGSFGSLFAESTVVRGSFRIVD